MPILSVGQIVRDTYTVERFLGQGAFAEVYRVQHRFLGRQAMKVLKTPGTTYADLDRMLGEALLLSKIGHPNIIRVYNADTFSSDEHQYAFYTMEYVAGGTLDHFWRSFGSVLMPVTQAVDIMRQVCSGIAVAHLSDPPIVHRDIKPQNIMVGYDGNGIRVRVSDFGLAKQVNPLTLLVSAQGTLGFKPPEAMDDQDSPAADVWALGTVFYMLLTDLFPYPGLDGRDVDDASRFIRPLRPASNYNINVDPLLDSILTRCLTVKRQDRYPNASALLSDLSKWQATDPLPPEPKGTAQSHSAQARGTPPQNADKLVEAALEMAQNPRYLMNAADLLEEAISTAPELREAHESRLRLWRRGICM